MDPLGIDPPECSRCRSLVGFGDRYCTQCGQLVGEGIFLQERTPGEGGADAPLERISIIIAARNEGLNVRKTIDSLLHNTFYPDFEILVMDDASEDGCCEFLAAPPYLQDARLKWVRSKQQLYAVGQHIRGTQLASGCVFRFLDAHHCFSPFWLANQYHSLSRRDFRAIVGSVIGVLDPETWTMTSTFSFGWGIDADLARIWHLGRGDVDRDGRIPWTGTPQIMVSRAVYEQIGGFLPCFQKYGAEDIEFCLRAYRFGYDCFVEPTSLVGHLYKNGFVNPVTWADLRLNNLILTYLHLDEDHFDRLCAENLEQPGFQEALSRFDQLKPQLEERRSWLLSHQVRSLVNLWT
jgi:glycosyltransferase involved in cell wall biosynthesis